ncbi:hypothetical protein HYU45_04625 [Candidatus Daviesbacteria bacterium]|nr:hypothetical protein [Candidatus Daviesbacteria bacterium]
MPKIETAAELVQTLTTSLSSLNRDTCVSRPMPVIRSEAESMQIFTEELKRSDLPHLAEAVAIVHRGESKGKDAGFSLTEAARFRSRLKIMRDFYAVASMPSNVSLLDVPAKVKNGEYRVGVTIGEIAVTLYELVFEAEGMDFDGTEATGYRAQTLSEQTGIGKNHLDFVLSPMMERLPNTRIA